jgi:putative membrane protein
MTLTEEEQQRLVRRVAEIEAATGAEIVTAVAGRCDHYPEIPWKAFALGTSSGAGVAGLVSVFSRAWEPLPPLAIIALIAGTALAAALLAALWPAFGRFFLGHDRAAGEVRQYTESMFLREELFRTESRVGILMLVALFEREVVIVPDRGVRGRVGERAFDDAVGRMTPLLGAGRTAAAFEAGLDAVEERLRASGFTGAGGKRNELPDGFVEESK